MGKGRLPALADGRNPQAEVGHHNQAQGEVADRAVASSVAVGVVLVLGMKVAHHQGGAGALDQGLEGKLEDDWRDLGNPLDLAPAQDRSSRQL